MLTFITVAGVAIALIVFLNLLNAGHKEAKGDAIDFDGPDRPRVNARRHLQRRDRPSDVPRLRVCPVCGTVLNQTEYLFASFGDESGGKRQAHIYGCRHCFRTDGVNVNRGQIERVDP